MRTEDEVKKRIAKSKELYHALISAGLRKVAESLQEQIEVLEWVLGEER